MVLRIRQRTDTVCQRQGRCKVAALVDPLELLNVVAPGNGPVRYRWQQFLDLVGCQGSGVAATGNTGFLMQGHGGFLLVAVCNADVTGNCRVEATRRSALPPWRDCRW